VHLAALPFRTRDPGIRWEESAPNRRQRSDLAAVWGAPELRPGQRRPHPAGRYARGEDPERDEARRTTQRPSAYVPRRVQGREVDLRVAVRGEVCAACDLRIVLGQLAMKGLVEGAPKTDVRSFCFHIRCCEIWSEERTSLVKARNQKSGPAGTIGVGAKSCRHPDVGLMALASPSSRPWGAPASLPFGEVVRCSPVDTTVEKPPRPWSHRAAPGAVASGQPGSSRPRSGCRPGGCRAILMSDQGKLASWLFPSPRRASPPVYVVDAQPARSLACRHSVC
jgi:hypothetical protein